MEKINVNNYINALKTKKLRDVKVASFNRREIMKRQDGKCAECKKELRGGYYKLKKNLKTKMEEFICSDCLISIPKTK